MKLFDLNKFIVYINFIFYILFLYIQKLRILLIKKWMNVWISVKLDSPWYNLHFFSLNKMKSRLYK